MSLTLSCLFHVARFEGVDMCRKWALLLARRRTVHGTCFPEARDVEEVVKVQGEGGHDDDCPRAIDYYQRAVSCDWYGRAADVDVNISARTGRLGYSRTGGSHQLIGIGRCDICSFPPPNDIGFLTGNGLPWGGNHRHVAADLRALAARHPYFGKVADRLAESGCCGVQSVG